MAILPLMKLQISECLRDGTAQMASPFCEMLLRTLVYSFMKVRLGSLIQRVYNMLHVTTCYNMLAKIVCTTAKCTLITATMMKLDQEASMGRAPDSDSNSNEVI
ncbi:hypothetical protein WN51_00649 [Melipona quadrifasciata]|uniref:Uncharacterized protein n=1 Tax=Melipona quadrifasciata TaxID=166423 RepID=A0A0M8ZZI9_9HYME|nr:hypothetical protein WN51_00649 [Melipona quadrifasciata]